MSCSEPIQKQPAQRDLSKRPPSSIYSQPSPNMPSNSFPRPSITSSSAYDNDPEISPPSSPDTGAPRKQRRPTYDAPVSPILSPVEEKVDISRLQISQQWSDPKPKPAGSSIPVLRREKRRNQVAAATANHTPRKAIGTSDSSVKSKRSMETLYDPLTGEFTTSDQGIRQAVKPGEFALPDASTSELAMQAQRMKKAGVEASRGMDSKKTVTNTAPNSKDSFGDRIRKLKDNNMETGARPEWKGSSGRTQVVPPVTDQLEVAPLRIPPKSNLRSNSPQVSDSGRSTPTALGFRPGPSETYVVSPTGSGYARSTATVRQIVPSGQAIIDSGSGNFVNSPTSYAPPSVPAEPQYYNHPTGNNPNSSAPYTAQPTTLSRGQNTSFPPSRDESSSEIERNFREALKDISLPGAYEQPPSRFSVTTYATTTASPRISEDSDTPPMPSPPTQPSPVLNRKRPKIGNSLDSTNQIARKAVGEPVFISMSSASRRNSKMLPKSPPEMQSADLISSLEAQLENLKQRRINIQRSIHQMTELMPTDVLARGMEAKRQADEKKKVEILREDLADVQREEHDLGLRLHRAWKRRDQNAIYEPTGLWVRRVTG
jgi:hypothetical protein